MGFLFVLVFLSVQVFKVFFVFVFLICSGEPDALKFKPNLDNFGAAVSLLKVVQIIIINYALINNSSSVCFLLFSCFFFFFFFYIFLLLLLFVCVCVFAEDGNFSICFC